VPSRVPFDARFQRPAYRLVLLATDSQSADRASNVWELWEDISMRGNRQRQCVTVASMLMMSFSSGLSRAQDTDSVLRITKEEFTWNLY
jgi:hypothetical protein